FCQCVLCSCLSLAHPGKAFPPNTPAATIFRGIRAQRGATHGRAIERPRLPKVRQQRLPVSQQEDDRGTREAADGRNEISVQVVWDGVEGSRTEIGRVRSCRIDNPSHQLLRGGLCEYCSRSASPWRLETRPRRLESSVQPSSPSWPI